MTGKSEGMDREGILCVFGRRRRLLANPRKPGKETTLFCICFEESFRIFFPHESSHQTQKPYRPCRNRNLTPSPESEPFAAKAEAPTVSCAISSPRFGSSRSLLVRAFVYVWAVWCGPTISSLFPRGRIAIPLSLSDARAWLPPKVSKSKMHSLAHNADDAADFDKRVSVCA